MGSTNNSLLAAIAQLIKDNDKSKSNAGTGKSKNNPRLKPLAKCRSKEEFRRLPDSGACVRCEMKGHLTKDCHQFDPALRPNKRLSAAIVEESNSDEYEDCDSGKDQP